MARTVSEVVYYTIDDYDDDDGTGWIIDFLECMSGRTSERERH